MTAIASISDLVNRLSGGSSGAPETIFWHKTNRIAGNAVGTLVAGVTHSLFLVDGQPGAASGAPSSAGIPTNSTAGSFQQTNPASGKEKWLVSATVTASTPGVFILYDRLYHTAGLNAATTSHTINSTALTRATNYIGNFILWESYATLGATATTISATYTNSAGTGSRASGSVTIAGTGRRNPSAGSIIPLASGDLGVKSVESVTLAASNSGTFGISICAPLAIIAVSPETAGFRDFTFGLPGLPKIETNACLNGLFIPGTSTFAEFTCCSLTFVEA